jgi:hypothetical protein
VLLSKTENLSATDDGDWAGIGIFDTTTEEVEQITQDDPGLKASILTYRTPPPPWLPEL